MTVQAIVRSDPRPATVEPAGARECGVCGVVFWMTSAFEARRREDKKTWYCPNGDARVFVGETEVEREKRLRKYAEERASQARADADQAEASRRAWKGQATKLRNRAAVGECPFCGQHLRDLARHVSRLHKDEEVRELTENDASTPTLPTP